MKYRIMQEASCNHNSAVKTFYYVQMKYPFIPIWFYYSEDYIHGSIIVQFATEKEARECIEKLSHKCTKPIVNYYI